MNDAPAINGRLSARENARRLKVSRSVLQRHLKRTGRHCKPYFLSAEQTQSILTCTVGGSPIARSLPL